MKASIIRGIDSRYHFAEERRLAWDRSSALSGDTRWHGSRFLGQKRRCFLGGVWGPVEEPALWASSQWPVLHGLGPICLVELTASPARDKPVVHADDSGVQAVTVPPPTRSRTE